MGNVHNTFGQPVGPSLPDWTPRGLPTGIPLIGRSCRLEKLDAERHAEKLYAAYAEAPDARDWTYLSVGPFADKASFMDYARKIEASADPFHYVIIDSASHQPVGSMALMRLAPENGVVEIGWVAFSPLLKRSTVATEATYLLMRYVFEELQYRRYEWKCDSLNEPSRRAAERYGFRYEGTHRNAMVYKGRSRDTSWFSITDLEWPAIRKAFETWLSPDNFDSEGRQRRSLAELRAKGMPGS